MSSRVNKRLHHLNMWEHNCDLTLKRPRKGNQGSSQQHIVRPGLKTQKLSTLRKILKFASLRNKVRFINWTKCHIFELMTVYFFDLNFNFIIVCMCRVCAHACHSMYVEAIRQCCRVCSFLLALCVLPTELGHPPL